jgi:hypothetical protein
MLFTRNKTERPREPLLYSDMGVRFVLCRIARRLRKCVVRYAGAIGEILVLTD